MAGEYQVVVSGASVEALYDWMPRHLEQGGWSALGRNKNIVVWIEVRSAGRAARSRAVVML